MCYFSGINTIFELVSNAFDYLDIVWVVIIVVGSGFIVVDWFSFVCLFPFALDFITPGRVVATLVLVNGDPRK